MPTQVHWDALLTQWSMAYSNGTLIADQVCPVLPVAKKSDKYLVFGREAFSLYRTLRAPRTRPAQLDWSVSDSDYHCEEYMIEQPLDDIETDNADAVVQAERSTVETLTDSLLLDHEKRVADILTSASTFTQNTEPDPNWNEASADPVGDVLAGKEVVRAAIGRNPNVMVLPASVLASLRTCTAIIDMVKYSAVGKVTIDLLRNLFEIDNLIVADAVYNSAQEGDTFTTTDVWGDTVGLYYMGPPTGLKQISAAKTFRMRAFRSGKYRDETIRSDVYHVSMVEDTVVTCAAAGYLLTNCNA